MLRIDGGFWVVRALLRCMLGTRQQRSGRREPADQDSLKTPSKKYRCSPIPVYTHKMEDLWLRSGISRHSGCQLLPGHPPAAGWCPRRYTDLSGSGRFYHVRPKSSSESSKRFWAERHSLPSQRVPSPPATTLSSSMRCSRCSDAVHAVMACANAQARRRAEATDVSISPSHEFLSSDLARLRQSPHRVAGRGLGHTLTFSQARPAMV